MISSKSAVIGLCILLRAGTTYTSAQVAPGACSPINEIEGIQAVLDEAANQKSACVELHGTTVTGSWSMEGAEPLSIEAGQQVVIDCRGNEFSMSTSRGSLAMGPGSSLHYINCDLRAYEFPENEDVRGTVHSISNSTFEMPSCTFLTSLSDQYAPLLVALQMNASFSLGELLRQGDSAAIHIYSAAFDSLLGPQFRYEILNSTGSCGPSATIAADAREAALSGSPDLVLMSEDASLFPEQALPVANTGTGPTPADAPTPAAGSVADAGPVGIFYGVPTEAPAESGGRASMEPAAAPAADSGTGPTGFGTSEPAGAPTESGGRLSPDSAATNAPAAAVSMDPAEIINAEVSEAPAVLGGCSAVLKAWAVAAAVAVCRSVWL